MSAAPSVTRAGVLHVAGQIVDLSARTLAAGQARVDSHASGKLLELAADQSLRVLHAAQADLAQRACERWLELLYDGAPATWWNVRSDGLVLKAPPWSRSRRTSYGLSDPQARLLRLVVVDIVAGLPERRQLYWYAEPHQRWAINRSRFPTLAAALDWQRTVGAITAHLWHAYATRHPGGRR